MEKIYHANTSQKKAWMAILLYQSRFYGFIIKGSIKQEDIK